MYKDLIKQILDCFNFFRIFYKLCLVTCSFCQELKPMWLENSFNSFRISLQNPLTKKEKHHEQQQHKALSSVWSGKWTQLFLIFSHKELSLNTLLSLIMPFVPIFAKKLCTLHPLKLIKQDYFYPYSCGNVNHLLVVLLV